ncbi:SCO6880 family protein [Kribbella lupini]|uniref:Type VII secretion system protein EccE domain-containing protein n=1 Tax=Kribbella lupini TaxID=291602 RepID=A0ABN2CMQ9_9ACTN
MTTTMATRFPRPERNTVLLGLRPMQVALLALAAVLLVLNIISNASSVGRLTGLSASICCAVVALARIEDLPSYRWILLRVAHALRVARKQQSYRASVARPTIHGSLHLPGSEGTLRILDTEAVVAAVHDPRRRRLTAVARIEGPAHLLQNTDEQDRRVTAYGQLIAGLCQSNRIVRAQILERTLPDPGDSLTNWAVQRGLDPRQPAGAIYQDLLRHAAPASAKHETLFAFTLDLDAVSREVRKHGGGAAGAMTVLEAEARGFQMALGAAGVAGCWLNAPELAMSLRVAFDPAATRTVPSLEALDPSGAGPLAIDAEWDRLRTDSSMHRVYIVTEWPRVKATPAFLGPLLLKPGVRRTFSLVLQPIPVAKALRDARRHQVDRVTERATRNKIGRLESEEDRQLDADVAQRERDLAAGHGDVRWIGLLAVSADNEEKLDEACTKMEIAAARALIDLRRLVGQQLDGFLATTLPFGTGLR